MNAILKFFGTILSFFSSITGGHYLFGLFIFALLVKLILVPFGIKQQKTSIKQSRLRPKEMAIRKKYAGRNDQVTQRKVQEEVMDLYQREGYNPASGCLPLLIQMPIILILYNVIINPLKYIAGWTAEQIANIQTTFGIEKLTRGDISLIQYMTPDKHTLINDGLTAAGLEAVDFSVIPNFKMGIFDLSATPTFTTILVLVPILTFVLQFASMKLTRRFSYQPMMDAQQQKANKMSMIMMDVLMPAMTTWIAFSVPAAIGIYWAFNNILGVLQQFILYKTMPIPKITEEDIKNAEREMAGKAPKHSASHVSRGPVRSLHTIDFSDDEVEEDLGDYISVYDKEKKAEDVPQSDVSEGKKKLFGKAKMKDDNKDNK